MKGAKIKPKTFKIGSKNIEKDVKKHEKRGLEAMWGAFGAQVGSYISLQLLARFFFHDFD